MMNTSHALLTKIFAPLVLGIAAGCSPAPETMPQKKPALTALEKEARLMMPEEAVEGAYHALTSDLTKKENLDKADKYLALLMAQNFPADEKLENFKIVLMSAMIARYQGASPEPDTLTFTPEILEHIRSNHKEAFDKSVPSLLVKASVFPGTYFEEYFLSLNIPIEQSFKDRALTNAVGRDFKGKAEMLFSNGATIPVINQILLLSTADQMDWVAAHNIPVFNETEGSTGYDVAKNAMTAWHNEKLIWLLKHGVSQQDKNRLLSFAERNTQSDGVRILKQYHAKSSQPAPRP